MKCDVVTHAEDSRACEVALPSCRASEQSRSLAESIFLQGSLDLDELDLTCTIKLSPAFAEMAKRPRESERPEAGQAALNNPHKRVLLSYDDLDDEDVQDAPAATTTGPDADAQLANYQMDTYSPEPIEKDVRVGAEKPGMAVGSSQENGLLQEQNKPLATATAAAAQEQSRGRKADAGGSHTHTSADTSGPLRADIRRDRRTNQFPVLGLPSADEEYAEAYDDEATAYVMRAR